MCVWCSVLADELIQKRPQPPLPHLLRVDLADGPRRGIAGIGKRRLARLFPLRVRALELEAREVDLAADLYRALRRALEGVRNVLDGFDIGGHIFACRAVPP